MGFGTMRHLEETARGVWRLIVRDKAEGETGIFRSWGLKIYVGVRLALLYYYGNDGTQK